MTPDELRKKITRCNKVIEGLKNYEPFKIVVEDFKRSIELSDNNWQYLRLDKEEDMQKFYELKYNKLSALGILNIIRNYEYDLHQAQEQLFKIENPDKVQGGYVDNE